MNALHSTESRASLGMRAWSALDFTLKLIMAVLLFVMMALTFFDVLARYVISSPIPGGYEIVQYLMAVVVIAGLATTTIDESHLSVSLLTGHLGRGAAQVHRVIISIIVCLALAIVAWRTADQAAILGESQQVSGFLRFPLQYVGWAMAALATVAFVVSILKFADAVTGRNALIAGPSKSTSQAID